MATRFLKSIFKIKRSPEISGNPPAAKPEETKSFRENQINEGAFDSIKRGSCSVPLKQITGSVGRYQDFDNHFRIKKHIPSERLDNIKASMRRGKQLPPVKLYQIKDEFFVLDGNHRVSAAKEFGHDTILADIVEFIPSKNTLENILYRQRSDFMENTGLSQAIDLSELGQYAYLEKQIEKHQDYLWRITGKKVSTKESAQDWYKTIYSPLITIIEKGQLIRHFRNRTLSDLYAYISFHQWEKNLSRKYGIGIDKLIPKDMEAFRNKMADMKEQQYPEMQRDITAFVLIIVKAKSEYRIMDKLFVHNEVKELHSVHGDVDVIAKIVLRRDLLSSDAEIIGQFVHDHIRGVSGVSSTQTLIPGYSKMK
ncbi:ParB N-terminal domain-containing protein [bacterium]|nr:ParB N-terminal domain-containing protein [bacterium]